MIFFIINNFFSRLLFFKIPNKSFRASIFLNQNIIQNQINKNNYDNYVSRESNVTQENKEDWHLEIPSINLNAKIKEGTTKEIMDEYIGHFEETQKLNGNIGLAAHNRGYKNNYFEKLKDLKEGEKVLYYYNGKCIEYVVKEKMIIKDTDWSYLEDTKDNRLTLITCVENEKEYRRCIQCKKNN